jgi:hypothetical protein
LRYQQVTGAGPVEGSWVMIGNDTPSNPTNSTKTGTLSLTTPGRWDFNGFGHDGYPPSNPGDSVTVWAYGQTNGATFVDQSINGTALTGANPTISLNTAAATATATIRMQNTGNKLWEKIDSQFQTPHRLGPVGSTPTAWGVALRDMTGNQVDPVSLSSTNNTATFTFTFAIPQVPNTYKFQWKMLEEGVVGDPYFGAATPEVTVTVIDTTPPSVPAGFSVTNLTPTS